MALRTVWTHAAKGRMPPIEQAKLWALREVLRKQGEGPDQYTWMASQVRVQGGGCPDRRRVASFFERVDKDPEGWFPGKKDGPVGRPVEMTPAKRRAIATAAQGLKRRRILPSYDSVRVQAPAATFNPKTGAPFSRNKINEVLTTDCFDPGATKPWQFSRGPQRKPLTGDEKDYRAGWARRLQRLGLDEAWFLRNVVWIDLCNKVIPGSPKKAFDQLAAGDSKRKRLMSPDAVQASDNAGGSKAAERQCSWGDTRVWHLVVMTRGRLGVHVFTNVDDFPGETPLGAGMALARLPQILRRMLGRGCHCRARYSATAAPASITSATAPSRASTTPRAGGMASGRGQAWTPSGARGLSRPTSRTPCCTRPPSPGSKTGSTGPRAPCRLLGRRRPPTLQRGYTLWSPASTTTAT